MTTCLVHGVYHMVYYRSLDWIKQQIDVRFCYMLSQINMLLSELIQVMRLILLSVFGSLKPPSSHFLFRSYSQPYFLKGRIEAWVMRSNHHCNQTAILARSATLVWMTRSMNINRHNDRCHSNRSSSCVLSSCRVYLWSNCNLSWTFTATRHCVYKPYWWMKYPRFL